MAELLLARIVSGATAAFKLGKNLLLERQLFRRRFEHECRALHRRREPVVHGDALQQRRIVAEQIGDRLQPPRQRGADLRRRLEHADVVPRGGEQIGDAVAHQAAADHADFFACASRLPR